MSRRSIRGLLLAVWVLGACGGDQDLKPSVIPPAPRLALTPPPGTFDAYELKVAVKADGPDAELFFVTDLGQEPQVTAGDGYQQSFSVRMVKTTQLTVAVLWHGRVWGPYRFEYLLKPSGAVNVCWVEPLADIYYRPSEAIPMRVSYNFANALSRLEVRMGGRLWPAPTSEFRGEVDFVVPAGSSQGVHELSCRVVGAAGEIAEADPQLVVIDGGAPTGGWVTNGAVTRNNWGGGFSLQAGDALSGIAQVEVCTADMAACVPATAAGADRYILATGFTTATAGTASIAARLVDRAGNTALVAPLAINLAGFARSDFPPPATVFAAFDSALNLETFAGEPVYAALRVGTAGAVDPVAAPLAAGWNDFAYRTAAEADWRSLGVYRSGLGTTLPASGAGWLLYAGASTAAGSQYELAATAPASGAPQAYVFPALRVAHWLWVRDADADGRWSGLDELYLVQGDTFAAPYFAVNTPQTVVLAALVTSPTSVTTSAWVSCTDCSGSGTLFFERRAVEAAPPVRHAELGVVLPGSFSLSYGNGERCTLFWDENDDGALNRDEPRARGGCDAAAFELARRGEALTVDQAGGRLRGVAFGGEVTAVTRVLSSVGDVLLSEPLSAVSDTLGFGVVSAAGLFEGDGPTLLDAQSRFEVWSAGQGYAAVFTAANGTGDVPYTVTVVDESGAPAPAVVNASYSFVRLRRVTQADGTVVFPLPAGTNALFYAERDGYLSEAARAVGQTVGLRIFANASVGRIEGRLRARSGLPLAGALLTWNAAQYAAHALTGSDGTFSLPVSGGDGLVTVRAPGRTYGDTAFPVFATTAVYAGDFTVDTMADGRVTYGSHLGFLPFGIDGADAAVAPFQDGPLYLLPVTDGDLTVVDYHGIRRRVALPGLLPGDSGSSYATLSPPLVPDLAQLAVSVRCGDRFQIGYGSASIDAPCWSWFAEDDLQTYFLGRVSPVKGFPPYAGFAVVSGGVFTGGLPAPAQEVTFEDRLFERTVRVAVTPDGAFQVVLPYGIYRVRVADGGLLKDELGQVVQIPASSIAVPYQFLYTP